MIIIVARYNENVEWVKQFASVLIYNKGLELNGFTNVINTENVGREGHTYYKYICDNYDKLEDYMIFLQGNPFDHSPNIISNINKYIDQLNNKTIDVDFTYLSEKILSSNLINCPFHLNLPLIETYEKIFDEKKQELKYYFGTGAQFIVSKTQILKRPKSFYEKIVQMLEYSVNPIEGFVIERFHGLIFENAQLQMNTQTSIQKKKKIKNRLMRIKLHGSTIF